MSDQQQLDMRLAEITDLLLANKQPPPDISDMSEELASEVAMVQLLHDTIAPDEDLSPTFRKKLTMTLNDEWEQQQRQKQHRTQTILPFRMTRQMVAAAAAAFVVVVGILLTAVGDNTDSNSVPGTVTGGATVDVFIVAGIGLAFVFAFLVWSKRR